VALRGGGGAAGDLLAAVLMPSFFPLGLTPRETRSRSRPRFTLGRQGRLAANGLSDAPTSGDLMPTAPLERYFVLEKGTPMIDVVAFGITICLVAGAILPAVLSNRRSFPLAADARDHPPWPTTSARAVRFVARVPVSARWGYTS
jgi:hypothetical protein